MFPLISPIPNRTPSNTWTCPNCKKEIEGKYCPWCGRKKQPDKVCPRCGTSYDATAGFLYCSNCGENLSDTPKKLFWICTNCNREIESNFCPWCGVKKPPERICSKCGTIYDATLGFSFCPNCGDSLSNIDEINSSWAQIIAHISDGTVRKRYAVGTYMPLALGEFGIINMQLAGFDLDECADGEGKAATTWIAMAQLSMPHRMNPEYKKGTIGTGSLGGWEKSELRQWLNDKVLPAMPDSIRSKMIQVRKTQDAHNAAEKNVLQTTLDNLWIPSRDEVFGDNANYYHLFLDKDKKRVRKREGSVDWWWLRSSYGCQTAYSVNTYGSNGSNFVNSAGGIVIGFCL